MPWIGYGVDLADYVLGLIPFAGLVGDQITFFYCNLIRPVANGFVVDLVAAVVNAPLEAAAGNVTTANTEVHKAGSNAKSG